MAPSRRRDGHAQTRLSAHPTGPLGSLDWLRRDHTKRRRGRAGRRRRSKDRGCSGRGRHRRERGAGRQRGRRSQPRRERRLGRRRDAPIERGRNGRDAPRRRRRGSRGGEFAGRRDGLRRRAGFRNGRGLRGRGACRVRLCQLPQGVLRLERRLPARLVRRRLRWRRVRLPSLPGGIRVRRMPSGSALPGGTILRLHSGVVPERLLSRRLPGSLSGGHSRRRVRLGRHPLRGLHARYGHPGGAGDVLDAAVCVSRAVPLRLPRRTRRVSVRELEHAVRDWRSRLHRLHGFRSRLRQSGLPFGARPDHGVQPADVSVGVLRLLRQLPAWQCGRDVRHGGCQLPGLSVSRGVLFRRAMRDRRRRGRVRLVQLRRVLRLLGRVRPRRFGHAVRRVGKRVRRLYEARRPVHPRGLHRARRNGGLLRELSWVLRRRGRLPARVHRYAVRPARRSLSGLHERNAAFDVRSVRSPPHLHQRADHVSGELPGLSDGTSSAGRPQRTRHVFDHRPRQRHGGVRGRSEHRGLFWIRCGVRLWSVLAAISLRLHDASRGSRVRRAVSRRDVQP
jgi:hypothetical protein